MESTGDRSYRVNKYENVIVCWNTRVTHWYAQVLRHLQVDVNPKNMGLAHCAPPAAHGRHNKCRCLWVKPKGMEKHNCQYILGQLNLAMGFANIH
jgi:hypothetical protein